MALPLDRFIARSPCNMPSDLPTAIAVSRAPFWHAKDGAAGVLVEYWKSPRRGGGWQFRTRSPDGADHVLAGDQGWLLGYDDGEFGGGLVEVDNEGRPVEALLRSQDVSYKPYVSQNVRGMYRRGERTIVLRGINHLGTDNGAIELFRGDIGSGLVRESVVVLPSCPRASAVGKRGSLLLAIRCGIVEFDDDVCAMRCWIPQSASFTPLEGKGRQWVPCSFADLVHKPCNSEGAWPFSAHHILDLSDEIYVGAGPLLIHLERNAEGLLEKWLIERDGMLCKILDPSR